MKARKRASKRNKDKANQRKQRRHLQTEQLERREMMTTFYVDGVGGEGGTGSDFNDGRTPETAFATIQRAANFARSGDTVEIRGGVYQEDVSLPRSGNSTAPITFRAFGNEEVVVSGGDSITGWTPVAGLTDVWAANVPWNANNNRDANTLFVNGELRFEAREQAEVDPIDIDNWGLLEQGDLTTTTLRADQLVGFGNDFWNGAKIRFHRNDFTIETRTIADYNSATGTVTFDTPIGSPAQKQDGGFYIFDTINALDRPGEWYKGQASDGPGEEDRLYYKAEPGQNPNDLEIEFKRRAFGFDARSRDYINIEGITFRGVSIDTNTNTDFNTYSNNVFYANDKANFGRFFIRGDNNTVRDSTLRQNYNTSLNVDGVRNSIVNNLIEESGYYGVAKVLTTSANTEELLVSHNTVRRFAEAFLDGYPFRSEFAYNVFEEGGLLSYDTGVFDSDGQNGNGSQSIFHHNVFRNTDSRGIYEAFYGRNNNAVIHNNLFYDFNSVFDRASLRTTGLEFRQVYHNTVISTLERAPLGNPDSRVAVQTRYNNNLQITAARQESLGVDLRGNFNYSPSDFVDFAGNDFQLAPGSGAIDTGILLPGINDDFLGDAPDAGAFEFGADPWVAGHNFDTPPEAVFGWTPLPGTNLYENGQFSAGISDWNILSGTPNSADRNSFNLQLSGAGLTDSPRTRSVEFTPGEAISRQFTGLKPNTTYTVGAAARVANEVASGGNFNASSGGVTTGTHRNINYATGISGSEWIRFNNIDFGAPGQFDQLDLLHIRNPSTFPARTNLNGVSVEVRLGSPTGTLLAEFNNLNDGLEIDRWRADRADFQTNVSGLQDIYVSVSGSNAAALSIGTFRLLKAVPPTDDLLTIEASASGARTQTIRVGSTDWREGFEEFTFTTGSSPSLDLTIANNGRLDAYLDRLFIIEGASTRGGVPREVTIGATAEFLSAPDTISEAPNLIDGSRGTSVSTADTPGAWAQVDFGQSESLSGIELQPASFQNNRLNNFRLSVWSADPNSGGTLLWSQDYLTDGSQLSSSENFYVQGDALGLDGVTRLNDVSGQFLRIELLGENNAGDNRLVIGDLRAFAFAETNVGLTDGITSQSSTEGDLRASNANDGDPTTRSATQVSDFNSYLQTQLPQGFGIGQIELVNHDGSNFAELSNFTVSVWDQDPDAGGVRVWERSYFAEGSVGRGGVFTIDGSEISQDILDTAGFEGTRRLASVHTGRVVRVQLNGLNNEGNGRLSLAELRITPASAAPPINNLAQSGVASQSSDFYGEAGAAGETAARFGFASTAIDGDIITLANFTSALNIPNQWWQVDLQQSTPIDQIVLYNRVAGVAQRLDNFDVEVWSDDPDAGGELLWDRRYRYSSFAPAYSTGSTIGDGGALLIDGADTDNGLRLDQVQGGRYVRVQQNDSDILSLVEVQVWAPDTLLRTPTDQTEYVFDLGDEQSPVADGALRVSPTTYGDVTWTGEVSAIDRGGSTADRDFITGQGPATFNQTIANGFYQVTVDLGDPDAALQNMILWAEGELISDDIDTSTGAPTEVAFEVEVIDGELNLAFDTQDDSLDGWAVSSIEISEFTPPGPPLAADYNLDRIVNAADFVVWRDTNGSSVTLPNEATSLGRVDDADLQVFRSNFGEALPPLVTSVLIDATTGNGEFDFSNVADATPTGGGSEALFTDINRDRAFRSTSNAQRGVAIPGWEIVRESYSGGNAALGVDGNYGFALNAGTGEGETGQAFANSGAIRITSDSVAYDFLSGDTIDLSYLLGSDTTSDSDPKTVQADVSLVFNEGLPAEFTHTFSTQTASGLATPAITETFTLPQAATSVRISILADGLVNNVRTLVDDVELRVTTDPIATATPPVLASAQAPLAQSAEAAPASSDAEVFAAPLLLSGTNETSTIETTTTDLEALQTDPADDELLLLLAADQTSQTSPEGELEAIGEDAADEPDGEAETLAIDLAFDIDA